MVVLVTGPEGRAWAREHGVEYPFPNDYHEELVGEPVAVEVRPQTVCTGAIAVGPLRERGQGDHLVDCAGFARALAAYDGRTVAVAAWTTDAEGLVQLSELYRP